MTQLVTQEEALNTVESVPIFTLSSIFTGQNPALVYLATLRPSGRRRMQQALAVIANLVSTPC